MSGKGSEHSAIDLGLQPLDENLYKVDLDLLGKYQDFTSELLKLSYMIY